ncbi:MAG TPA: citrate/2-methylcitrate synthase [Candidatus Intestinimonas pullistercoris]|uniref:Citrate synthase n=1 Tax=Candidatus Intestinimonas pullistercoris TaxID=2838623 RepID=A0A9D2P047_9FIRM|nr:citrate/2-methylcitrate synthase [uncultured Intestinimonas sp.]HJC41620.1 citrate/2-methylcitrate synthase [Candidatus Intestinimonas pullistercoris]
MSQEARSRGFIESLCGEFQKHNSIDPTLYEHIDVKRGLRNADGTGVMAGITQIGNVQGYYIQDGERVPMEGRLIYRGIDVEELIQGFLSEGRFGFEETAYLLLFGALPTRRQLEDFNAVLSELRPLPPNFTEDMILRVPGRDVMNRLGRCVLALYCYDPEPEAQDLPNELRRALQLVARCPMIVAHSYAAKRHYFDNDSLYLHRSQDGLSLAENFLHAMRHDKHFTPDEARLLDLCMVLHAEHGGGNNSAFACRVLSSSGTDIYAAISAAVGSLKGPRHGGANKKVMEMFRYIQEGVSDWKDDGQVRDFLQKLLCREAGDRSGLIYGMGHAIYTLSDPRAKLLKRFAKDLADQKGMLPEFELVESVERLAPQVINDHRGQNKPVCANVDLYSGLVYKMLDIPEELYTPLFAMARMVGWCAHRVEEVYNPGNKIIRPAYKAVAPLQPFVPLDQRG